MIPPFNASMVLPPFVGDNPGVRASMAPYSASMLEFVQRFATSNERLEILKGLLSYRKALSKAGIADGFQWIDGSFVENVEESRKRPPADVDLVTFASTPYAHTDPAFGPWLTTNSALFNRKQTKAAYKCDAFFVDFKKAPRLLVDDSRYWFGLFSHQRDTALWKGMIQVPMLSDDDAAQAHLDAMTKP
ncbi:MAG: DUF6932 family protein [Bacillota bacterium]